MSQVLAPPLAQPTDADFPPVTQALDEEAILCRLELDDRNLEFDEGVFKEKRVSVESGIVALWIGHLLLTEALKTTKACVMGPDVIYRCWPNDPKRFRKPDVSVVAADRMPPAGSNPRTMNVPPDLAVEVISPTNTIEGFEEKLDQYRQAGFGRVWVVHLPTRTLDIHEPDGTVRRLRGQDEVTAGDVLPGFSRRVEELFPPQVTR